MERVKVRVKEKEKEMERYSNILNAYQITYVVFKVYKHIFNFLKSGLLLVL